MIRIALQVQLVKMYVNLQTCLNHTHKRMKAREHRVMDTTMITHPTIIKTVSLIPDLIHELFRRPLKWSRKHTLHIYP